MNANERFELMAEEFYKKTGMLAPGKDSPPGFHVDSEKLASEWFKFCTEYNERVYSVHYEMIRMLESKLDLIRCGIGSNYSGDPKQNPKYLEVVELLAKARGEHD